MSNNTTQQYVSYDNQYTICHTTDYWTYLISFLVITGQIAQCGRVTVTLTEKLFITSTHV